MRLATSCESGNSRKKWFTGEYALRTLALTMKNRSFIGAYTRIGDASGIPIPS